VKAQASAANHGNAMLLSLEVCYDAGWQHTFDVTANQHGWTIRDAGSWSDGTGFVDGLVTYPPTFRNVAVQYINSTPFTLTRLAYTANNTPGVGAANVGIGRNSPGAYIATPSIVSGSHQYDTGPINLSGTTNLYIDNIIGTGSSDPGGSGVITSITVEGVGFDPFLGA
jgi:hypothetical protein